MQRLAVQTDGRRRRAERNQAAVVDAMLDLHREGDLRPRVDTIARRAGVSERTVFRLFDDLEALHAATIERQAARVAPLLAAPAAGGSRDERISALVAHRLALHEAVAPTLRAGQLWAPFSPVIQRAFEVRRQRLRRQVERQFAPELDPLPAPVRAELSHALDAATSMEVLEYLRAGLALSAEAAGAIITRTVRALLAEIGAERDG